MTNDQLTIAHETLVADTRAHTRHALAEVGLRLARSLALRFDPERTQTQAVNGLADPARDMLAAAIAFAGDFSRELGPVARPAPPAHPLRRLETMTRVPGAAAMLSDLLLLACLPEAHEGYGTLCRLMHPDGIARPTAALALHWLESEANGALAEPFATRDQLEDLLCHSPLVPMGLVQLRGEGPWHARSLYPGAGVWEALMARPPRLDHAELVGGYEAVPGLEQWLASAATARAVAALRRGLLCHILLVGGDAAMRATRARALLGAAHAVAVRAAVDGLDGEAHVRHCAAGYTAAFMHQACLWLESRRDDQTPDTAGEVAAPRIDWALPIISSARSEKLVPTLGLPLIRVPVEQLAPVARRALWQSLLPQLGDHAGLLAARYPIDPDDARDVVRDLGLRQTLASAPLAVDQIGDCIRARTPWHGRPGVQRVTPRADWDGLLLPRSSRRQIESAVRRVLQQITVLDDWGFAQDRAERRGVRLLFFGPPGTGKSLAAEVMAQALGVDLLVVDLASLVSKWIGETEKNLSAVFDMAERSRALLLFDEADALFAKRTDSHDAHDRYANLETAYLLQRLERYEGVTVLTTNLRANLDNAFSRRFEFIVDFPEPDATTREALWRLHLPQTAPLADDVDLAELAGWYTLSGAQIKNAALAAAFLAAAKDRRIHQHHFLLAIEREFDKAGRAHPGFPPHYRWQPDEPAQAANTEPLPEKLSLVAG
jgi:hypothetical protein